ncbi:galactose-specific lectin nattectin-like [Notolabrus celidotus]|uniref:galactose-specific lectin nattectin-like n=1 Tax=Notolabrus celidotus TaxID=1203425 RepID=UPI00148FD68F|nr:galactose-specific lectin nattectin-like [Notolabrus celidotus]
MMALSLKLIMVLWSATGLWVGAEACGASDDCCKTCPAGWSHFGKSCLIFHHDAKDWADAEKFCTTIGGNLASVHSKDLYLHLRSVVLRLTGKHMTTWLGGYDAAKDGVWLWSDGSLFDFKLWGAGEPNGGGTEMCMEMNYAGRDYVNDVSCTPKRPFFCSKAL